MKVGARQSLHPHLKEPLWQVELLEMMGVRALPTGPNSACPCASGGHRQIRQPSFIKGLVTEVWEGLGKPQGIVRGVRGRGLLTSLGPLGERRSCVDSDPCRSCDGCGQSGATL